MSEGQPGAGAAGRVQSQHLSTFPRIRASGRNDASRRARWTMYEVESDRPGKGYDTHLKPHAAGQRRSSLSNQLDMTPSRSAPNSTPGSPQPPQPSSPQPSKSPQPSQNSTLDADGRQPPPTSADYVIAVVGHEGVGKSTVIRRAIKTWGGSQPVTTHTHNGHAISSSFAQIKAGGKLPYDCKVEFVEVNLKALDLSGVSQVWPSAMSQVSGAILCYDADRRDTLRGLSEALHQLCPALPMVLFACKSDPDRKLEVDAQVGDSIGQPYNVGLIEVTTATPQGKHKMRTGLRWLLYRLEERQRREQRHNSQASSCAPISSSPKPQKDTTDSDTGTTVTTPITTPPTTSSSSWRQRDDVSEAHSSISSAGWIAKNMTSTATSTAESVESTPTLDGEKRMSGPQYPRAPGTPGGDQADTQGWTSLPELMNRLFTAIVSTENDQFVLAFFMTYRRFCLPVDLMTEFLDRFVEVEQYAVSRDIRLWALMKLAGALQTWTSTHPGDLADPETQALFRQAVSCMLKYPFLGHITSELVITEQALDQVVDLDQSWSLERAESQSVENTPQTPPEANEVVLDQEEELDDETSSISKDKPRSTRTMSTASLNTDADNYPRRPVSSDRTTDSSSDISRSVYSGDDIGHQRWSSAITAVLHMDAHVFALELTRMQWELFTAIRPRDVLRHDLGKERDEPVGRSIEFFNHVSRWVSTMVLAHPKAKTRAKVYEAFVKVAHQLRRLNNYDSLCAVIAGLRETSVHRLSQTHALVKLEPPLMRDFQSHMKLMDARGGYQHYRRALQADSTYGHTAIPLMSTILSLVSRLQAGRPEDFRSEDGFIQWGKFSRFGEILAVIPDFQARGTMVPGHASVSFRRLIEATPVIANEDGLYERSKVVEPGASLGTEGRGGSMFRKLANLAL